MNVQAIGTLWLLAALLFGLLSCFFGYRLFLIIVAIAGLVIGGLIGYQIGLWIGSDLVAFILAVILAVVGAWASVAGYYAFIFVVGAFAFALLAAFLAGLYSENVPVLLLIIVGIVGGLIALWLQRVIIIIATSAEGALSSVLAVVALFGGGGVAAYRSMYYRLLNGQFSFKGGAWFYVIAFVWLVLFALGLAAQFTRGKEMYRRPRPEPV